MVATTAVIRNFEYDSRTSLNYSFPTLFRHDWVHQQFFTLWISLQTVRVVGNFPGNDNSFLSPFHNHTFGCMVNTETKQLTFQIALLRVCEMALLISVELWELPSRSGQTAFCQLVTYIRPAIRQSQASFAEKATKCYTILCQTLSGQNWITPLVAIIWFQLWLIFNDMTHEAHDAICRIRATTRDLSITITIQRTSDAILQATRPGLGPRHSKLSWKASENFSQLCV